MSERWKHLLLGSLLLGQLLLLAAQERARGGLLERLTLDALGPVVHSMQSLSRGVEGFFGSFRLAGSLREENRRLRQEIVALQSQLVQLHGVEEELERLSRISGFARPGSGFLIAAVVYIDRSSWLRTLVIYTGREQPQRNQPVVTAQGLVGRIVVPAHRYAKVLLITDRSASVSSMIRRTRRRGMVRGGGEALILDNIPLLADVRVGDEVVTAGIDGVFPPGIPIGEVTAVEEGRGLFHRIRVAPAIDFGLLDQVFVLTEEVIPAEVKDALYGDQGSSP